MNAKEKEKDLRNFTFIVIKICLVMFYVPTYFQYRVNLQLP